MLTIDLMYPKSIEGSSNDVMMTAGTGTDIRMNQISSARPNLSLSCTQRPTAGGCSLEDAQVACGDWFQHRLSPTHPGIHTLRPLSPQ